MHSLLLVRTRELIGTCPCESGCPSCVGPEGNTGPQAKAVALHLLDDLLRQQAVLEDVGMAEIEEGGN